MRNAPRRPEGSGPETTFVQWVWDSIMSMRLADSPTVKWSRTTRGISAKAIVPPTTTTEETTTDWFYGDYDGAAIPAKMAVFHDGDAYVSLSAVPAGTDPTTGAPYWAMWPSKHPGTWSI